MIYRFIFFATLVAVTSCRVIEKTDKRVIQDGYYTQRVDGRIRSIYIDVRDETVHVHPTTTLNRRVVVDTAQESASFPLERESGPGKMFMFTLRSMDVDFLTIPVKFRPKQYEVQRQLNTGLNASVYLGYRMDSYVLNYVSNPLAKAERKITHFGFSLGLFTGFGNTPMTPTNTNNILLQEYDGIVWSSGLAGIFAVNKFTVGLALGFDNLLDKNKTIWIYQQKPWLGIALGLNLN